MIKFQYLEILVHKSKKLAKEFAHSNSNIFLLKLTAQICFFVWPITGQFDWGLYEIQHWTEMEYKWYFSQTLRLAKANSNFEFYIEILVCFCLSTKAVWKSCTLISFAISAIFFDITKENYIRFVQLCQK